MVTSITSNKKLGDGHRIEVKNTRRHRHAKPFQLLRLNTKYQDKPAMVLRDVFQMQRQDDQEKITAVRYLCEHDIDRQPKFKFTGTIHMASSSQGFDYVVGVFLLG